jgi:hypothetical protein
MALETRDARVHSEEPASRKIRRVRLRKSASPFSVGCPKEILHSSDSRIAELQGSVEKDGIVQQRSRERKEESECPLLTEPSRQQTQSTEIHVLTILGNNDRPDLSDVWIASGKFDTVGKSLFDRKLMSRLSISSEAGSPGLEVRIHGIIGYLTSVRNIKQCC